MDLPPPDSVASTYREVRRRVTSLDVAPGAVISVGDIADALAVPTQEAADVLARLARERLLLRSGEEYRVAPLSLEAARELFHVRAVLEGEAAASAAKGDVDLDELRRLEALGRLSYNPRDPASVAAWVAANADFHTSVARGGGNERLVQLLEQVFEELARYLHLSLLRADGREAEAVSHHVRMLDALKRGDSDEARRVAKAEVAMAQRLVLDALLSATSEGDVEPFPRLVAWP